MGIEDDLKRMGPGVASGVVGGALSGNPVVGALSGVVGSMLGGHPILQMLAPMLLMGGLQRLLGRFRHHGLSSKADSWVAHGPNEPLTEDEVRKVIEPAELADLATRTGLSESDVVNKLAVELPTVVDHLTPNGQMPSEDDLVALM